MTQNKAVERLYEIQYLLLSISRFHIVNFFGAKNFDKKMETANEAYKYIYKANQVFEYLKYMYNQTDKKFAWDTQNIDTDTLINLNGVNVEMSNYYINNYKEKIKYLIEDTRKVKHENELMFYPIFFLLDQIALDNVTEKAANNKIEINIHHRAELKKVITGPKSELLDDIYEPTYSLLDIKPIMFGGTIENNVEYFWNLGIREILASDLCALSIVEYDNMPFEFYYDFITQLWDETRHACHYLNLTKKLLPEIFKTTKDERLKAIIESYLQNGTLPIPKEKNFYEAMQNASLQERMILLNIRTEAPAVNRLTKKMKSEFCKQYVTIKDSFQYDKNDEIRHGSIGVKWLKYLYPDTKQRNKVMEDADILRGFLIATALSMYSEKEYLEFLSDFKINFEWI